MSKKITMNTDAFLSFDDAFSHFIRKCQTKNLSPRTIESYKYKIKSFRRYTDENGIALNDIDENTVDEYILWLRENYKVNDVSVNSNLRAVRAFTYYCMDNGNMRRFKIRIPKAEKKIKETYTEDELRVLLKKPNVKQCTFTEYKTWAFENFLLGTGVRISTALNVKIGDIDFHNSLICLRKTKSRVQSYIPLSKSLESVLQEYLSVRGNDPEDYVFCSGTGGKGDKRTYQKLVRDYNHARGIKRTGCHIFRHTFAKLYILNGGDAFRLQKLLCHSTLTVTREYVELFGQDLARDYDRLNPLDCLKGSGDTIKMPHKKRKN